MPEEKQKVGATKENTIFVRIGTLAIVLVEQLLLNQLFPYTGLGVIIVLPLNLAISVGLMIVATEAVKNVKNGWILLVVYVFIIGLIIFYNLVCFPQDVSPNPIHKMLNLDL